MGILKKINESNNLFKLSLCLIFMIIKPGSYREKSLSEYPLKEQEIILRESRIKSRT